jgi:nitroreductase
MNTGLSPSFRWRSRSRLRRGPSSPSRIRRWEHHRSSRSDIRPSPSMLHDSRLEHTRRVERLLLLVHIPPSSSGEEPWRPSGGARCALATGEEVAPLAADGRLRFDSGTAGAGFGSVVGRADRVLRARNNNDAGGKVIVRVGRNHHV